MENIIQQTPTDNRPSSTSRPPIYPKLLIVPLSNPDTAELMLRLASTIVDPVDGQVIALIIALESGETVSDAQARLQSIIAKLNAVYTLNTEHTEKSDTNNDGLVNDEPKRIRLIMRSASSITRGILDATREYGANAMIMGVNRPDKRQVKIGSLVENIIQGAMCDILAYRPNETSTGQYERVIVPLDGKSESFTALRFGTLIANALDIPLVYTILQRRATYDDEFQQRLETITNILPAENIHPEVAFGHNSARIIMNRLKPSDLLVLGFSQKNEFEQEIEENMAKTLLNEADASVLLASRLIEQENRIGDLKRFLQRFNLRLTKVERDELIWKARQSVVNNIDYMSMIILSASLASLGLLLNSAAVIIGAMLVAPLLTPLVALSAGIISGEFDITKRSLLFLIQGITFGLFVSIMIGFVFPIDSPTNEMLGRGSPSLLDAGVALFSGWAAAYATARKDIPAALAGVAIAAALMPPLCTVGLGLALGNYALAFGASLLFLTNIVFIVAMQAIIFFWFGLQPAHRESQPRWTLTWWGVLSVLVVVVVFQLVALSQRAIDDIGIQRRLTTYFEGSQYVSIDIDEQDENLLIVVTLRTDQNIQPGDVARAQADLSEWLERSVLLNVAHIPIISAGVTVDEVPQLMPPLSDTNPDAEATAEPNDS